MRRKGNRFDTVVLTFAEMAWLGLLAMALIVGKLSRGHQKLLDAIHTNFPAGPKEDDPEELASYMQAREEEAQRGAEFQRILQEILPGFDAQSTNLRERLSALADAAKSSALLVDQYRTAIGCWGLLVQGEGAARLGPTVQDLPLVEPVDAGIRRLVQECKDLKAALAEMKARFPEIAEIATIRAGLEQSEARLEQYADVLADWRAGIEAQTLDPLKEADLALPGVAALDQALRSVLDRLGRAQAEGAELAKQLQAAVEQQKALQDRVAALAKENADLKTDLARSDGVVKALKVGKPQEDSIRTELLGLRASSFDRVLFVVDASRTMGEGNAASSWENIRSVISMWMQYLPMRKVAVITFNNTVRTFPKKKGEFLELRDAEFCLLKNSNQADVLEFLESVQPVGSTATYDALSTCLDYGQGTTVFLFTDGCPERLIRSGKYTMEQIGRISSEIVPQFKDRGMALNTIAMGDYTKYAVLLPSLREWADRTGGTFIGK